MASPRDQNPKTQCRRLVDAGRSTQTHFRELVVSVVEDLDQESEFAFLRNKSGISIEAKTNAYQAHYLPTELLVTLDQLHALATNIDSKSPDCFDCLSCRKVDSKTLVHATVFEAHQVFCRSNMKQQ